MKNSIKMDPSGGTSMIGRALIRRLTPRCMLSTAPAPSIKPLHLLLYSYADNAVELRKPHRAAHLAAAHLAAARGELLLGGALADPVDGGVLVFAGGPNVAESFAMRDPYVTSGVVTSFSVREWSLVVGSLAESLTFVATYEWQHVPADGELPGGLDIELPLDDGPRRARIPPSWQWQVWLGQAHGYLRTNVQRDTKVHRLKEEAASRVGASPAKVSLSIDGDELADNLTVEEVGLFSRTRRLVVKIDGAAVE